jgi:two-component system sensor histidine kinase QseC
MRIKSISHFLLTSVIAAIIVVVSTVAYWTYQETAHEVEEIYDAELAQATRMLQTLLRNQFAFTLSDLQHEPSSKLAVPSFSSNKEINAFGHKYESKLAFFVWDEAGNIVLSNHAEPESLGFNPALGYGHERMGNYSWRTFSLHDAQLTVWIKVAQRSDIRDELVTEIIASNILPFLLVMPVLALLGWFAIQQGLLPLKKISAQIKHRQPSQLHPLDTRQVPMEITPLIEATNSFMERISNMITREREFMADAAHELRTPLASIRIHAQNLGAYLTEDTGQLLTVESFEKKSHRALANIVSGVDRMSHVVEQLMTLARLEHPQTLAQEPIRLASLVQQMAAQLAPLALNKEQDLALDISDNSLILGHRPSLETLIRNLIDNAIRYTPRGGHILLELFLDAQRLVLRITDDGPGIRDEEKPRVWDRFYRLEHQEIEGSGLGLAIVRAIAEQHGASCQLRDNPHATSGLIVELRFPLAPLL